MQKSFSIEIDNFVVVTIMKTLLVLYIIPIPMTFFEGKLILSLFWPFYILDGSYGGGMITSQGFLFLYYFFGFFFLCPVIALLNIGQKHKPADTVDKWLSSVTLLAPIILFSGAIFNNRNTNEYVVEMFLFIVVFCPLIYWVRKLILYISAGGVKNSAPDVK